MHLTESANTGRACLIRDGWCGSGLAPLISWQDSEGAPSARPGSQEEP